MNTTGFKARPNGFWITFENGWTISVQFGPGNYCENRDHSFCDYSESLDSRDAECAVFDPSDQIIRLPGWDDSVKGWLSPKEVLGLMVLVSKK